MFIEKFVAILLISKYLNIRLSQARFCISKDTRNIVTNNPVRSIFSQIISNIAHFHYWFFMTTKRSLRMSKDSILLLSLQHYRYIISWFALLH